MLDSAPPDSYKHILIRRSGALGDVILTTPIVRRFLRENSLCKIEFITAHTSVFEGIPAVHASGDASVAQHFVQSVDLDLAYERDPARHIVDAFMLVAFGDEGVPEDKQQILFRQDVAADTFGVTSGIVFVHAARSWISRTLPLRTWSRACLDLARRGFTPIAIGTAKDMLPQWCQDYRDRFTLGQLATLFDRAAGNGGCFLGMDSALLHVAGATHIPIAGVFTSVLPQYRLPYRNGMLGRGCVAIQPALPCLGCQARGPTPRTTELCSRQDYACVSMVEADQLADAVLRLTAK